MARIAYLMSHYPAISHAFVLREVEHVRAAGVDLETLSTHRAEAADLLAAADRHAAATTFSVLPTSPGTLLGAHLEALIRSPRRYLATLALALRTGAPGARRRRAHPRAVRRRRDRRRDARNPLPPRPARQRSRMLVEPRSARIGGVL